MPSERFDYRIVRERYQPLTVTYSDPMTGRLVPWHLDSQTLAEAIATLQQAQRELAGEEPRP